MDVVSMVNELLTTACSKLPEVPPGVRVVTPMTILEPGDMEDPKQEAKQQPAPQKKR